MATEMEPGTSPTLLGRLRLDPADQAAWAEFVRRYVPRIHAWCRHWGLQEADAQDVTQTVLTRLAEKMRSFAYDPSRSFRAWLKTVTHHAWKDYLDALHRPGLGSGDGRMGERLNSVEAREDLVARLDREFDREVLEEAVVRVKLRVAPQTWEAFRRTALEQETGAAVAAALGMAVTAVFMAKSRVQAMLREEVARLDGLPPG